MKTIVGVVLFLFIVGIPGSYAQQQKISGLVKEAVTNAPLPGASVVIRGTRTGVATDLQGKFTILTDPADELVISFVGMKTQIVRVKNNLSPVISLERENLDADEAIVIAFGKTPDDSYTGSAVTVRHDAFRSRPIDNILQALEGNIPGLQTTSGSGQPGASPDLRIRGFGSITASASPLFIMDGVPYTGDIAALHPEDIDNISVLKDAASAALYGSRGANGVVILTTKKGKNDKSAFKVKINQGFSSRSIPEYDRVDAYAYYPLMWEAYRNSLVYNKNNPKPIDRASHIASYGSAEAQSITDLLVNNPFNVPNRELVGTDGKLNPNARLLYPDDLDWEDAVSRTGYRGDYSLSASGGTEATTYYMSVAYTKNKSYLSGSELERTTARAQITTSPDNWLQTGIGIAGALQNSSYPDTEKNTGYANPFFFSRYIAPVYPIHQHAATGEMLYDSSGKPLYEWTNRGEKAFPGHHIVAETELNGKNHKQNALYTRAFAEIRVIKGLTFTFNASYDLTNNLVAEYENPQVGDAAGSGRAKRTNDRYDVLNFNQLLNFKQTWGNHRIETLLGHESYSNTYKLLYGAREGEIISGNDEFINFTQTTDLSSYYNRYRTEGYFLRFGYNYGSRYFLSASYRRDGSSRFHKTARWGNFWSVGASWLIDRENFMKKLPWVDRLKLRSSYGQTGNDNTDSWYPWQNLYAISNNGNEPGFIQNTAAGNRNLKWELNKHFDIAVEFNFLNRIGGTIEYFKRTTDDLLFNVPQPLSGGVLTQWQNSGSMYNKGMEFTLRGTPVAGAFQWEVGIQLTHFKNKITSLPQKEISAGVHKRMAGHSIYDYFLPVYAGVDPDNGDALYRMDITDETGQVTEETTTNDLNKATSFYCGTAMPKIVGAIDHKFSYKGLDFAFKFTYRLGGKTYDNAYSGLMHSGLYGRAFHTDILKRWEKAGDRSNVPRLDSSNGDNSTITTSQWLTKASYLALKSVTLSYSFPERIPAYFHLKGIRLYGGGENIFMLTHRKGMNPQYRFTGISGNDYTPARTFSFGIDLEF